MLRSVLSFRLKVNCKNVFPLHTETLQTDLVKYEGMCLELKYTVELTVFVAFYFTLCVERISILR